MTVLATGPPPCPAGDDLSGNNGKDTGAMACEPCS